MADLYKVNSIVKRVQLTATGEFLDVYEISFTTISGITSTVSIPVDRFSKDYVAERIQAEAVQIEEVMKL